MSKFKREKRTKIRNRTRLQKTDTGECKRPIPQATTVQALLLPMIESVSQGTAQQPTIEGLLALLRHPSFFSGVHMVLAPFFHFSFLFEYPRLAEEEGKARSENP